MKTYEGQRFKDGCTVWVHKPDGSGYLLPLRLDLRNHSPDGFEWGYAGSGPAQLALALVADALGDDQLAAAVHQAVKSILVCPLARDGWVLTESEVRGAACFALDHES